MPDKEFIKFLDEAGNECLRIKIKTENGEITDIVIQYESFIKQNWEAIIRYDCAHGFFHRDVLMPNGNKEKQSIAIENLNDALLYAEQDLKDRWEFYKNRYLKKGKTK